MKKTLFFVLSTWTCALLGEITSYNELIAATIDACNEPDILLAEAFTNDMVNYRNACTNVQGRCAVDLSLAISLMHRLDHDEECVGSQSQFARHQMLVSNVVHCTELEECSWIRYAAAVEYVQGLNLDNQQSAGFIFSTNMLAKIMISPPDMGQTNYWNSMSQWMKCPNEALATVFRMNAAIWLAEQNRMAEFETFTNSLPSSAIRKVFDDIN